MNRIPRLALLVALACLAVAAPVRAAVARPDSAQGRFPSEEALRRYLVGRMLEQQGRLQEALGEYYRALALDPRSSDLLVRVSELSAQLGDPTRSLEYAERALVRDPDDWRALWLQGAARFSMGRTGEALEPLERACELDSTQAEVLRTTARVAETVRRPDVAERAWRRLAWVDPEDGEAWFQVAAAQARRGDFANAEASLERALELNPARPGSLFLLAWVQESRGRVPEAIETYLEHLEMHPDDTATRRRLVGLLVRADRPAEAYDQAVLVQRTQPDEPEGLQVLADLAFRVGRVADAERALARLRQGDPGLPDGTARAIVILLRHERGREAARIADEWMRAHPTDPAGALLATRTWAAAGRLDSAVVRARRAVALAPDSVETRRTLARTLQEARRFPEAETAWQDLRRLQPHEPGVWLELGACRDRAGDVEGAIAAGREALRMAPDWPPALNFVGYVLADHQRELPEALALIERALAAAPENGAFVDSHGWVLHRLGRHDEARARLERAVELTDGDPVVHEHLGDVFRVLGQLDRAREQYRLGLEAEGENEDRLREKLRSVR